MDEKKTALVAVESDITRDPRVRRQVDWLVEDGWTVDTLGLGPLSTDTVRDHFALGVPPAWTRSAIGTAVAYGLMSHAQTFSALTISRFPVELRRRVRDGGYALVVLNDRHFVPWVTDPRDFTDASRATHIHLDLHEYFPRQLTGKSLWTRLTGPFYRWGRSLFGDPAFTTRSTVNSGISRIYADEFGIPAPAIIRNCPPYIEQEPRPVDDQEIRLLHHGMASWDRGLRQIVDAMRHTDERFTMTFMLLGNEAIIDELRDYASDLGDRVRIEPPAPMRELSAVVNHYDLEVMYYEPATRNLELALPNKLFEAVQGRLGLVVGRSPMMTEIVERYGNGAIVDGWGIHDLADRLNALSADDVRRFKAASHRAAHDLSAENERSEFFRVIAAVREEIQ